jgi:aminoglycoside phosphotransferase (APT) family kinase protein
VIPLAGGFGKETTLFEVSGKALNGAFVMRRDLAGGASITNDCHRNVMEYPVIKAAHARGFPAPDAVWLDTEHTLLSGGDFIIMRKSPGTIGGNFFGAQTEIPETLVDSLAAIMAGLHNLEPLTELGDLNPAINTALWGKSRGESTADYIRGWRDYFLTNNHTPSPSLIALFGWLVDNVPPREGRAVLLHGDFGFHNFLFEDGKLSAVLDWEFAHIGDPAEELGYVRETIGNAIDWDRLMTNYLAAGGDPVDDVTLRYFRVWAHVRNAAASNLVGANFVAGLADDLKLTFLPYFHFPMFIKAAQELIDGA